MELRKRKSSTPPRRFSPEPASDFSSRYCSDIQELGTVKRSKTVLSYYNMPARLAPELVNLILVHLDTKSLAAIKEAADVYKAVYENGNAGANKRTEYRMNPYYMWKCFESFVEKAPAVFYEEAIKCQFSLVAEVFTRAPAPWTSCPDSSLWGEMDSQEAFEFFEFWTHRTELCVRAIQRGFWKMRATNLMRFFLTHLWFWYGSSVRCPAPLRAQEGWNYFASLSVLKQNGITNFFDNLGSCLQEEFPPRYPHRSTLNLTPSRHLCANCTRLLNGSKSTKKYPWRLPKYIPTELEAMGVTDLICKLLAMNKLLQLYELLNTRDMRPLTEWEEDRILNFFDPTNTDSDFWYWDTDNGPALLKFGPRTVIRVDTLSYEIWVEGSRGDGRIELRMPNGRPSSSDWPHLFSDAVLWQQMKGKPLNLKEWMSTHDGHPSYSMDRVQYWCWTEWLLDDDQNIGLDVILFGDAPW